ncbi:hypothetical protein EX30DRAFT_173858 [Ascodesmis nigricans]|uniref:Uncharacterized protein n=1 Tax=Ascodesmis nigricans TaxID=341454 RepID=A0A4S2MRQ3_9PEZI|nr:hypothetical protein EX30DRAFT_173858 [Ascodesmis nigricans]
MSWILCLRSMVTVTFCCTFFSYPLSFLGLRFLVVSWFLSFVSLFSLFGSFGCFGSLTLLLSLVMPVVLFVMLQWVMVWIWSCCFIFRLGMLTSFDVVMDGTGFGEGSDAGMLGWDGWDLPIYCCWLGYCWLVYFLLLRYLTYIHCTHMHKYYSQYTTLHYTTTPDPATFLLPTLHCIINQSLMQLEPATSILMILEPSASWKN